MARSDLRVTDVQAVIDLTGTTGYAFIAPTLVRVHRVGIYITTDLDDDCAFTFAHTDPAGVAVTGGEPGMAFIIPAAAVVGEVYYKEAANFDNGEPQVYLAGEAISAVSDGVPTAGDGVPFLEFEMETFVDAGFVRSDPTAAVTSPADSTRLANLTRMALV